MLWLCDALTVFNSIMEDEDYKLEKLPWRLQHVLLRQNNDKLLHSVNVDESLKGTPEKYVSKDEDYWDSDLHDTEEKEVPWHLLKQYIKYIRSH
ncbi:unnamed protein product [Aspergillus oryzae]|nr:unnamed protein product [Aspergillus oryzae]